MEDSIYIYSGSDIDDGLEPALAWRSDRIDKGEVKREAGLMIESCMWCGDRHGLTEGPVHEYIESTPG